MKAGAIGGVGGVGEVGLRVGLFVGLRVGCFVGLRVGLLVGSGCDADKKKQKDNGSDHDKIGVWIHSWALM